MDRIRVEKADLLQILYIQGQEEQQRQADSLEACLLMAACCSVFSESRLEKEACRLTCAVLLSTSSCRKINTHRCRKENCLTLLSYILVFIV